MCIRDRGNAKCFWCAETKQCDTYTWHRDFLEPAHCSFNEWHYNHCYVQEILFVIVITVLALLLLMSICLFTYYCHKARRLNQQREHGRGSDKDGHNIELLDDGKFSSKSSSSFGNCGRMYGKLAWIIDSRFVFRLWKVCKINWIIDNWLYKNLISVNVFSTFCIYIYTFYIEFLTWDILFIIICWQWKSNVLASNENMDELYRQRYSNILWRLNFCVIFFAYFFCIFFYIFLKTFKEFLYIIMCLIN